MILCDVRGPPRVIPTTQLPIGRYDIPYLPTVKTGFYGNLSFFVNYVMQTWRILIIFVK